jgi:hypothetical protein
MTPSYFLNSFKMILFFFSSFFSLLFSLLFLFSLFFSSFIFLSYAKATPDDSSNPSFFYEPYSVRPDILKLEGRSHALGSFWDKSKAAQMSFIASLLAFNDKQTHFYFIARNSEYLYDTARLITQNTEDAKRIHLISISPVNFNDPQTKIYLAQQGLTESQLLYERKALLIDTDFLGTVPRYIQGLFKKEVADRIQIQLLVSGHHRISSSRIFLFHFDSGSHEKNPDSMHLNIVDYESLAKYTKPSDSFRNYFGVFEPVSAKISIPYHMDRILSFMEEILSPKKPHLPHTPVSPLRSTQYMEDLKAYWERPSVQKRFYEEYSQLLWLKQISLRPDGPYIIKETFDQRHSSLEKNFLEAQIRDLTEHYQKVLQKESPLNLKELGIKPEIVNSEKELLNHRIILQLLDENLEKWLPVFKNPHQGILNLFEKKDWASIEELIPLKLSSSVTRILEKYLFTESSVRQRPDLVLRFIYYGDSYTLRHFSILAFENLKTERTEAIVLKLILTKQGPRRDLYLPLSLDTQSISQELNDLIKKRYHYERDQRDRKDRKNSKNQSSFSSDDDLQRNPERDLKHQTILSQLITYFFSQPHNQHLGEALKLLQMKLKTDMPLHLPLPFSCGKTWL